MMLAGVGDNDIRREVFCTEYFILLKVRKCADMQQRTLGMYHRYLCFNKRKINL